VIGIHNTVSRAVEMIIMEPLHIEARAAAGLTTNELLRRAGLARSVFTRWRAARPA